MSLIEDFATAQILAPHSRFRFVDKPYFSYSDFPWNSGVLAWNRNTDFIADHDGQYIYPAPVIVWHDQAVGYAVGYEDPDPAPSVGWEDFGNVPFTFRESQPEGFTEFHLQQTVANADVGQFEARAEVSCQGVTYLWSRRDQQAGRAADLTDRKYTTFRIGVGFGADRVLYSVRYVGRGEIKIAKSYDQGTTWEDLETLRQQGQFEAAFGQTGAGFDEASLPGGTSTFDEFDAPRDMNYLEFRLIAGRLMIWTGSNGPYVFDENRVDADGVPIVRIGQLTVKAYKFTALAFSAHPTKWKKSCVYDSPEIPIGFNNSDIAQPFVDAAGLVPPDWAATVYEMYPGSLDGPIATFRLALEGPTDGTFRGEDFADYCPAVRAVTLGWNRSIIYRPTAPLTAYADEISVAHEFNLETLQIESSGSLLFNNNRPRVIDGYSSNATWGEWLRDHGQVAADLYMSRTMPDGSIISPIQVFAGYGNNVGEVMAGPEGSSYTMGLVDRKIQLKNPRWDIPWLDGWNVFFAIAQLAQMGGVAKEDLGFAGYVPDQPFGVGTDLGAPDRPNAYYLPVGDAGSVLTRFSGANLWEIMSKICYSIGYMLFFDATGILQMAKFKMPAGTKRRFYESDHESTAQPFGGYEGCKSVSVAKDMGEVRNQSMLIGMRAFTKYEPIVYKLEDEDSIYDASVFNHLGYRNPSVWMDSQFSDEAFAFEAATELFRFVRSPGYSVSLVTWLQCDIFPLDMIQVQSRKLGTYDIRMMVTGVRHTVNKNGGMSMIRARYIPEF
jgi:hypothetical protein